MFAYVIWGGEGTLIDFGTADAEGVYSKFFYARKRRLSFAMGKAEDFKGMGE